MIQLSELWIGWSYLAIESRISIIVSLGLFVYYSWRTSGIACELYGRGSWLSSEPRVTRPGRPNFSDARAIAASASVVSRAGFRDSLLEQYGRSSMTSVNLAYCASWIVFRRRLSDIKQGGLVILWLAALTFAYTFSLSISESSTKITRLSAVFETNLWWTLETLSFQLCLGAVVYVASAFIANTLDGRLEAWQMFVFENDADDTAKEVAE
jgi:hypothetical protein